MWQSIIGNKKWLFRRLILISLIIIFILFIFELILRSFGLILLLPQEKKNQIYKEDFSKIRILALGESTTADYFAPTEAGAWPRQLERLLNQKGFPTRVYNEGIAATTSAFILSNLNNYLALYKPHIVISMMGVNDTGNLIVDSSLELHPVKKFLYNL